jgi:hypothetical protein
VIAKINFGFISTYYQADSVNGHTGRRTFVSLATNAGVDSQIVAAASKHKDVNSVKGYYVPDQLAVSRATVACASTALRASIVDTTSSSEQLGESVIALTHMTLQQGRSSQSSILV